MDFAPFRAYDPEIGRWFSRDPKDVAGGINLYEYVEGDPVNAVDPWGLLTGQAGAAVDVFVFGHGASGSIAIVSGLTFPYETKIQGGVAAYVGPYTGATNGYHTQVNAVVLAGVSTFNSPDEYAAIDSSWAVGANGVGIESGMSKTYSGRSYNVIAGITKGGEVFPVTLSRAGIPSSVLNFNCKVETPITDKAMRYITDLYYWNSQSRINRIQANAKSLRDIRMNPGLPTVNPLAFSISISDGGTASTLVGN